MISIIIPIYNGKATLHRCLLSILQQQAHPSFEIIIIDDNSTDGTINICYDYRDRYPSKIRVFSNISRLGVSSSRNLGMKNARGDYICFVDADDELYSKDALRQLYHPEYDLVCGNFQLVRDSHISLDKFQLCTAVSSLNRALFIDKTCEYINCPRGTNNLYSDVWAKLHRTSIIKDNNLQFSQHMTKDEVVAFSLDYARYTTSCLLVPDIVYRYYSTEEMAYHSKYEHGKGNMVFNMVSTFRAAERFLDTVGVDENKDTLLRSFIDYYLNRYLYYNGLLELVE